MKTLMSIWLGMILCVTAGCAEKTLPLKTGYLDVGKTKLYYEEMGEGRPLIMIHGGLLDCRMWDPQLKVFAQEYRTIRYDVSYLDMPGILEIADRVKLDVPGAELVVMPDVAHMVNMEKPEAFNKAVLDFLAKN